MAALHLARQAGPCHPSHYLNLVGQWLVCIPISYLHLAFMKRPLHARGLCLRYRSAPRSTHAPGAPPVPQGQGKQTPALHRNILPSPAAVHLPEQPDHAHQRRGLARPSRHGFSALNPSQPGVADGLAVDIPPMHCSRHSLGNLAPKHAAQDCQNTLPAPHADHPACVGERPRCDPTIHTDTPPDTPQPGHPWIQRPDTRMAWSPAQCAQFRPHQSPECRTGKTNPVPRAKFAQPHATAVSQSPIDPQTTSHPPPRHQAVTPRHLQKRIISPEIRLTMLPIGT